MTDPSQPTSPVFHTIPPSVFVAHSSLPETRITDHVLQRASESVAICTRASDGGEEAESFANVATIQTRVERTTDDNPSTPLRSTSRRAFCNRRRRSRNMDSFLTPQRPSTPLRRSHLSTKIRKQRMIQQHSQTPGSVDTTASSIISYSGIGSDDGDGSATGTAAVCDCDGLTPSSMVRRSAAAFSPLDSRYAQRLFFTPQRIQSKDHDQYEHKKWDDHGVGHGRRSSRMDMSTPKSAPRLRRYVKKKRRRMETESGGFNGDINLYHSINHYQKRRNLSTMTGDRIMPVLHSSVASDWARKQFELIESPRMIKAKNNPRTAVFDSRSKTRRMNGKHTVSVVQRHSDGGVSAMIIGNENESPSAESTPPMPQFDQYSGNISVATGLDRASSSGGSSSSDTDSIIAVRTSGGGTSAMTKNNNTSTKTSSIHELDSDTRYRILIENEILLDDQDEPVHLTSDVSSTIMMNDDDINMDDHNIQEEYGDENQRESDAVDRESEAMVIRHLSRMRELSSTEGMMTQHTTRNGGGILSDIKSQLHSTVMDADSAVSSLFIHEHRAHLPGCPLYGSSGDDDDDYDSPEQSTAAVIKQSSMNSHKSCVCDSLFSFGATTACSMKSPTKTLKFSEKVSNDLPDEPAALDSKYHTPDRRKRVALFNDDLPEITLRTPVSAKSRRFLEQCGVRERPRKIRSSPYKILDAPDLVDDFYLNTLAWSKLNTIAVGLQSTLYISNMTKPDVHLVFDFRNHIDKSAELQARREFNTANKDLVCGVAFNNNGHKLAVGVGSGSVRVFDVSRANHSSGKGKGRKGRSASSDCDSASDESGTLRFGDGQSLTPHLHRCSVVHWRNTHSSVLATGSRDRCVWIRDIRIPRRNAHSGSPATSSRVRSYHSGTGMPHSDIIGRGVSHSQEICGLRWSWDDRYLASGGNDNKLLIWDSRRMDQPLAQGQHKAAVKALAWSPHDYNLLATGGGTADRCLRIWDLTRVRDSNRARWRDRRWHGSGGFDGCDSLNSPKIGTVMDSGILASPLTSSSMRDVLSPPSMSLSGGSGGSASHSRMTSSMDVKCQDLEPLRTVDTGSQVCNVIWPKIMDEIITTHGYSLHQITLWSYPSLTKSKVLTGHTCRVLYLAGSPDGRSIVTGAGDQTLRFWKMYPDYVDDIERRMQRDRQGSTAMKSAIDGPGSGKFSAKRGLIKTLHSSRDERKSLLSRINSEVSDGFEWGASSTYLRRDQHIEHGLSQSARRVRHYKVDKRDIKSHSNNDTIHTPYTCDRMRKRKSDGDCDADMYDHTHQSEVMFDSRFDIDAGCLR